MSVTALRDQVFSLPQLIRDTTWEVEEPARAAQFAWQHLGGVPTLRR